MNEKNWKITVILSIFIVGTLIYANSLNSSFHYDDRQYIVENPAIKDIKNVKTMWEFFSTPSRFVPIYSFALNYHFHQTDVLGYHLINLIIHLINAFLVWWFVQLMFTSPKGREVSIAHERELIGFAAALLFLTHPIQTQAVTYITQRFASLATLFYLSSLCFYAKARMGEKGIFYALCFLTALFGIFTKEIIITLPLMILFYEFSFISGLKMDKISRKKIIFVVAVLVAFACIIPSFHSFKVINFLEIEVGSGSHKGDVLTPKTYFLTQSRVLWTYIRLLFLPINQNLDYDFAISHSLFDPKTFLGFVTLLLIFTGACAMLKRNRLIAFGVLWFFITSSVESSVIVIRNVIFEHRAYLPSVGVCIAFAASLFVLVRNKRILVFFFCIVGIILSLLTINRNKVWQSDVSLWEDVVKKSPYKARAHHNLGVAYVQSGNLDKSLEKFNKAIALDPAFVEAYNYRGNYYSWNKDYKRALSDYNKALRINPKYSDAYYNIGLMHHMKGKINEAIHYYSKAIELNAKHLRALNNRGTLYMQTRDYSLALNDFNEIIETYPHIALTYRHRSQIFKELKQYTKAREDAIRAESLK